MNSQENFLVKGRLRDLSLSVHVRMFDGVKPPENSHIYI